MLCLNGPAQARSSDRPNPVCLSSGSRIVWEKPPPALGRASERVSPSCPAWREPTGTQLSGDREQQQAPPESPSIAGGGSPSVLGTRLADGRVQHAWSPSGLPACAAPLPASFPLEISALAPELGKVRPLRDPLACRLSPDLSRAGDQHPDRLSGHRPKRAQIRECWLDSGFSWPAKGRSMTVLAQPIRRRAF